jgi:hypothetical protein
MVTFLVARAPTGPTGVATEWALGPASALLRHQLDALAGGAEAVTTVARSVAAQLGPGVAGTLAGLAVVVAASVLVAGVAGLVAGVAGSVARRGGGRWPSGSARGGWTAGASAGSRRCATRSS